MKKFFFILFLSFIILLVANISWLIINIYLWSTEGLSSILPNKNDLLLENIYYSSYIKWIIWTDLLWVFSLLIFIFKGRHFKTDLELHYLKHFPILDPKIVVIIPAFNEEESIQQVVKDYINQQYVQHVIVIDNKSTDNTVELAKNCGAIVITKERNKGFSHSYLIGLQEAIKTDANIIASTEADGTYEVKNIENLLPYLDYCDLVTGSRQVQVLNEKDNQNGRLHNWGNFLLAKLIQFKYFNLSHMGVIQLTDVGCGLLLVRRTALTKVIDKLALHNTVKPIWNVGIRLYLLLQIIEHDLKLIEVPIIFKKRHGKSKIGTDRIVTAIKIGLSFLWIIIRY